LSDKEGEVEQQYFESRKELEELGPFFWLEIVHCRAISVMPRWTREGVVENKPGKVEIDAVE